MNKKLLLILLLILQVTQIDAQSSAHSLSWNGSNNIRKTTWTKLNSFTGFTSTTKTFSK